MWRKALIRFWCHGKFARDPGENEYCEIDNAKEGVWNCLLALRWTKISRCCFKSGVSICTQKYHILHFTIYSASQDNLVSCLENRLLIT